MTIIALPTLFRLTIVTVVLQCLVLVGSAVAELSVEELLANGRPANLYMQAGTPAGEFKVQCDYLLHSLNEKARATSTDIQTILLRASFGVDWTKERVDGPAPGLSNLRTATIDAPQGSYDVAVFSNFVHDSQ